MSTTMPTDRLFLRQPQMADLDATIRQNEAKLSNPHIQDKPAVRRQTQRLRKQLDTQRAPELDADGRDKLAKRSRELEAKIKVGMPSHEEMRKNPHGAVGAHQRWEKANKKAVIEWKNCQVALNPGDTDPELSSVERLRGTTSYLGMHDVQIPGKSFSLPSESFKDGYDEAFGKTADAARPTPTKKSSGRPGRKPYSENARAAASARMTKLHADKRAAKQAAQQAAEQPQGAQIAVS